jgi:hypothetical protein
MMPDRLRGVARYFLLQLEQLRESLVLFPSQVLARKVALPEDMQQKVRKTQTVINLVTLKKLPTPELAISAKRNFLLLRFTKVDFRMA